MTLKTRVQIPLFAPILFLMKKKQSITIPTQCQVQIQNNAYIFSGFAGKTILDAFQCDGVGNRFRRTFQGNHQLQTAFVENYLSFYSPFRSKGRRATLFGKVEKPNPFSHEKKKDFFEKTHPFFLQMEKEIKQKLFRQGSLRPLEAKMNGAAYGYVIFLKLIGIGYKFSLYPSQKRKDMILLSIKSGQSHKIKFFIPKSVGIFLYPRNTLALFSSEQEIIANLAYQIRHVRPPTPYKGKGIRYLHESIVLKEGKKIK